MFVFVLSALVLGAITFHIYIRKSKAGIFYDKIPGLPPLPILGNLLDLNTSLENVWLTLRNCANDFYPIYKLWFMTTAVVVIRHPDDIEILLKSRENISKGYAYDYLLPWLKTGLLTSTGEKWHSRRKILTTAFHFNILKKYYDVIFQHSEKMVKDLESSKGDEVDKDILSFTSKHLLDTILESAMGTISADDKIESSKQYKEAIYSFGRIVAIRSSRPYIPDWLMNLPIWPLGIKQKKVLKVLSAFSEKVVQERKLYLKQRGIENIDSFLMNTDESSSRKAGKKNLAMMDLLILTQKEGLIDDEGIKEEVDTFTFEGHDTTTMGMSFTLMLLAEHKEVQNLARIEVNKVFNRYNGKIGLLECQELVYLDRCIKESLRLYPSVPQILRKTTSDLQLRDYFIPANTDIMISFCDLHRDANFWPEPDKFDPDRFLPEIINGRHPFSYLPFSAGPRNCIGQKFAMLELKLMISQILYNFEIEPIDRLADITFIPDLVIRPNKPMRVKFVKIKNEMTRL